MSRTLGIALVIACLLSMLGGSAAIARGPVTAADSEIFEPTANGGVWHGDVSRPGKRSGLNAAPPLFSGTKNWVMLRCAYQSAWRVGSSTYPKKLSKATFETMFGATEPNIANYWADTSYGHINTPMVVQGGDNEWRAMPQPNSAYGTGSGNTAGPNITASFDTLFHDCASVWNDVISFTYNSGTYYAITLDDSPGACGVGGNFNMTAGGGTIDGNSYLKGTLVGDCQDDSGLWVHEMAHAFDLPHSESPNSTGNTVYNTAYDALSAPCGDDGLLWNFQGTDPRVQRRFFSDYGCLPSNIPAYDKYYLGWITPARTFHATGGAQTITLDRTQAPFSATEYLMGTAEIDSQNFISIEARFKTGISDTLVTGFDENLPSTGPADANGQYREPCCYKAGDDVTPHAMVVLYLVTPGGQNLNTRLRLQGTDDNGDGWWDDPGTQWRVGETYTYSGAINLSVTVNSMTTHSFNVTITRSGPTCNTQPFTDVGTGSTFCKEIKWMKDQGISTGNGDGTYSPAGNVTRGAMAAFMARLALGSAGAAALPACSSQPFTDVATNHPFCKEIQWMQQQGITTGNGDGTYGPQNPVLRQAMSAFIARLALGTAGAAALPACSSQPFSDVATGHPFCKEIKWMADNDIAQGFGDGGFHPTAAVTRQAMASFMFRAAAFVGGPI
jgi:hypothetical protein